jgi:hypothetical protein
MWPFKRTQKTVTSEEFAAALMELMGRSAKDFCVDLQKQAEEKWPFESDEVGTLGTQIFIAYLWMVSKALGPDKRVLDLLHDGYLSGYYRSGATKEESVTRATAAQSELFARYEKYYKTWDDGMKSESTLLLAFEMSQFFFPKRKPVLDAFLHASIQARVGAFMVSALEFRKKYTIVDT